MNTIKKISKFRLLYLCFVIAMFFIDFSMKGCYFLFLLLIDCFMHFHQFNKYFDTRWLVVQLFSFLYYLFAWITGLLPLGYSSIVYPIIVIPLLYIYGCWFGQIIHEQDIHRVVFFAALCVALIPLISVFKDIIQNGFVVDYRNVQLTGSNVEKVATGIGTLLVILSAFIVSFWFPINSREKWLYSILAILALICGLRVQTRSQIITIGVVLIVFFWYNRKNLFVSSSNKIRNTIILIAFSGIAIWAYNYYSESLLIMDRFQSEDMATGNTRTELATLVFKQIPKYPFGGNPTNHYAHNLWLDAARVAGILPSLLLLIISISSIKDTIRITRSNNCLLVTKQLFLAITVAYIVSMSVEPIIEGAWQMFLSYCFYIGIGNSVRKLYA